MILTDVNPERRIWTSSPRNAALIGATEKEQTVGRTLLANLTAGPFRGPVFPINPKRATVLGRRAYPAIAQVPEPVDLAVIATPAASEALDAFLPPHWSHRNPIDILGDAGPDR